MNSKLCFVALLVFASTLAVDGQTVTTSSSVLDTSRVSTFLSNTWNRLRDQIQSINANDTQSRLQQITSSLSDLRQNMMNATADTASQMMGRLQNLTQQLNTVLRERVSNDSSLVTSLYQRIANATSNGPDQSVRQAFQRATQTMAENYSGLANSSIILATDMLDKSRDLFDSAMIRAGNDTNRAVEAANTAIQAIKDNAPAIDETAQQVAANMARSVQQLSAGLRDLMQRSSTAVQSGVQTVTSTDFRQRAEQAFQNLMTSMDQLRGSLNQMSTTTATRIQDAANNMANNEVDVIGNASQALTREYEAVRQQIQLLRASGNDNN